MQKNKLNFRICGIHLLKPYKTVVSHLKLQLLKIIGETKSVTYRFYFFVGNLPKFLNFLESMTKIYLVEFKIYRKMAYYSLQKIILDRFPRNFFI